MHCPWLLDDRRVVCVWLVLCRPSCCAELLATQQGEEPRSAVIHSRAMMGSVWGGAGWS